MTNVCSSSRSQFKIKHCMTVFGVRFISFDNETMCNAYVWPRSVEGQGQSLRLALLPMLHMGYSSPSVIALVYDFTFLYKKNWFHPVTYGGRHDCFRFRKHPSSFPCRQCFLRAFPFLRYIVGIKSSNDVRWHGLKSAYVKILHGMQKNCLHYSLC